MPTQTHRRTFACTPEVLFDYLADFEHDAEWRAGVVGMRPVGTVRRGVGACHVELRRVPGRTVETESVVTALERPGLIEFERANGPIRPRGSYRIEPAADGSTLTCSIAVPLTSAHKLLTPIVALLLRLVVGRAMPKDFERLAAALEESR